MIPINNFLRMLSCLAWASMAFGLCAQDSTPPALLSSLPADNEQAVPINAAIAFTFNEPMGPGYSVTWGAVIPNRTRYWTADKRTIIYLFSEPLPANTLISWE